MIPNYSNTIMAILVMISGLFACSQKPGQSVESGIPVLKTGSQQPMPDEWIDEDTGHKIKRITRRAKGGRSFYFHNNPFVKAENGDDLMVFYGEAEDESHQLFSVNLATLEIEQLTDHSTGFRGEIVTKKSKEVFYQSRDSVFATNILNKETRLVYIFPEDFQAGITTINADETLLAGSYADPIKDSIYRANPKKGDYFNLIYEAKIPHTLFTVNIETGELKKLYSEEAWLNHVQFSTTDPDLLMYDHEGPWHLVDRIWTINVKTSENQLMHERTVHREIAGHEFFGRDGATIWYDLQKPRGETFFLAGVDVVTLEKTIYAMKRNEWSIHFNISPDQKLFAGDGGDSTQVAHAPNGQWIYLFTPEGDSLKSEKLVNMEKHGYRPLEPNVHFSPDGKWLIFRSDLDGTVHSYAVEIEGS
ncbi:MAG: oligogalacturonate lyase family protein [Marinoscillum sp.]